jgi:Protein of unknown function (DUF1282).
MNHVWGLLAHPNQEMRDIKQENESVSHHYTHHVLLMAAIPVICAFMALRSWAGIWAKGSSCNSTC